MSNQRLADRALAITRASNPDQADLEHQDVSFNMYRISRFAWNFETSLARTGARCLYSSDADRPQSPYRRLPDAGWPCSIWQCPDESIGIVYENTGETAAAQTALLRYASHIVDDPNYAITRYAGQWDGEHISGLHQALYHAVDRIVSADADDHEVAMALQLIEVPFSDRIKPDHPWHTMGLIHGIDRDGNVLLSNNEVGPMYQVPGDSDALLQRVFQAEKVAQHARANPVLQALAPHHDAEVAFFTQCHEKLEVASRQTVTTEADPDTKPARASRQRNKGPRLN